MSIERNGEIVFAYFSLSRPKREINIECVGAKMSVIKNKKLGTVAQLHAAV